MLGAGGAVFAGLFLYYLFRGLESEAKRWKAQIVDGLSHIKTASKLSP
jgi:hypothetical protein